MLTRTSPGVNGSQSIPCSRSQEAHALRQMIDLTLLAPQKTGTHSPRSVVMVTDGTAPRLNNSPTPAVHRNSEMRLVSRDAIGRCQVKHRHHVPQADINVKPYGPKAWTSRTPNCDIILRPCVGAEGS
jgi:hypothetical protein